MGSMGGMPGMMQVPGQRLTRSDFLSRKRIGTGTSTPIRAIHNPPTVMFRLAGTGWPGKWSSLGGQAGHRPGRRFNGERGARHGVSMPSSDSCRSMLLMSRDQ
jgi:hypothetical protein